MSKNWTQETFTLNTVSKGSNNSRLQGLLH